MSIKTREEFQNYFGDDNVKELMRDQIEKCYFEPLIKFLKNKLNRKEIN
jgi:hypothetical protein